MRKYEYDVNYYNFEDKTACTRNEIDYMLIRCLEMFRYKNLPSSIPYRTLELFLQTGGVVGWTDKPDGVLRVFFGGLGGEPDEYYRPTIFTLANPALKYSAELKIIWDEGQDGDLVVMLNDGLRKGLLPLHRKFASQIVENELSLKVSCINSRMPFLLSADDERTYKSALDYIHNIENGKIGIVNDSAFLEGLKEHQLGNQTHMVFNQLVEHNQYIRSTWYAQLGLNSMFNMKKEAISDAEKQMSEDELLPLIDNMLEERKRALEIINEKFGTNIEVEFNSSWEDNIEEVELNHEVLEAEANGESDTSDNGLDISTEDEDGEFNGQEEITDEGEGESTSEEGSDEGGEQTSDDNGNSENDNINIEVNIDVNSDDNEEPNIEEEEVSEDGTVQ